MAPPWRMVAAMAVLVVAGSLQYFRRTHIIIAVSTTDRRFLEQNSSSNDTIAQHLLHLTLHPHVAGSPQNLHSTAGYVLSAFKEYGLHAYYTDYQVLLSYPLSRSLSLLLPNGTTIYTALLREEEEEQEGCHAEQEIIPTFHAYSPSGDVLTEAVYVNYGRPQDYEVLRELGVNLTGAIVIARYGKIFRGDIVALAAKAGAAAALVYSDPLDYGGSRQHGYYPESRWLPPTGVQRGTVFRELGDPLTPGWPSNPDAERLESSTMLPSIPSLPISAVDALPIISSLEGPIAPPDWQGSLDIPAYRIGRGPTLLRLSYLENQTLATIRNVFGVIRGSVEPDRYVLLGNHRDAWTYGAVDPNSGTAALLEVARRFGALQKEGWRPRRSIYLCNWDAEEYGLIGSTEWVEENKKLLTAKAIAYINVDTAVCGAGFVMAGTPQLDDLLKRIVKKVKDPDGRFETLYESWAQAEESSHEMDRLGGTGSDYAPFLQHTGVPSVDVTFGRSYPVYHSAYDNYQWMVKFGDPFFHRHVAIVEVWGLLAIELADADILPFDYQAYAVELQVYAEAIREQLNGCNASQIVTVHPLMSAISKLGDAARSIQQDIKVLHDTTSSKKLGQERIINDRLMLAERGFLECKGLARGDWYKHLVFGPTTNDDYASTSFPGIQDALSAAKDAADDDSSWAQVQHQVWRAARATTNAALALRGDLT